jgi:hypothetical protein
MILLGPYSERCGVRQKQSCAAQSNLITIIQSNHHFLSAKSCHLSSCRPWVHCEDTYACSTRLARYRERDCHCLDMGLQENGGKRLSTPTTPEPTREMKPPSIVPTTCAKRRVRGAV